MHLNIRVFTVVCEHASQVEEGRRKKGGREKGGGREGEKSKQEEKAKEERRAKEMGRRGREGQGREGVEERKVGGMTLCIYRVIQLLWYVCHLIYIMTCGGLSVHKWYSCNKRRTTSAPHKTSQYPKKRPGCHGTLHPL